MPEGWGGYVYVEADAQLISARIGEKNNEKAGLENLCAKGTLDKIVRELEMVIQGLGDEIKQEFRIEVIKMEEIVPRFERAVAERIKLLEKEIRELEELEEKTRKGAKIRIECPYHGKNKIEQILGRNIPPEVREERTGFNSYCVCLDCLHQFEADLRDEKVNEWRFWFWFPSFKEAFRGTPRMKDDRKCPECGSTNVKTEFELIGKPCPKCKEGIIMEIETGIIS
jgi:hypothetical protein